MMPVGKPIVWTVIGIAALEGDFEWAGAVALAWGGMIRLPSDLVNMTTASLVGPGRGDIPRWALLLYPIEGSTQSKTLAQDEGVLLRAEAWRGGGGDFLKRTRATRPSGTRLSGRSTPPGSTASSAAGCPWCRVRPITFRTRSATRPRLTRPPWTS